GELLAQAAAAAVDQQESNVAPGRPAQLYGLFRRQGRAVVDQHRAARARVRGRAGLPPDEHPEEEPRFPAFIAVLTGKLEVGSGDQHQIWVATGEIPKASHEAAMAS